MTIDQFIKKYLGKQVEYHSFDPRAKYQCVDLANQFIVEVLGLTPVIGTDAKDFPSKVNLSEFEVIKYTKDFKPKAGDIPIWSGKVGGGAGHIGAVRDNNATLSSFNSVDQNWSKPLFVTLETHGYTNVTHFLRAKISSTPGTMPETIQLDSKKFEELVTKSSAYDAFEKTGVKSVKDIEDLRRLATESVNERNTALEEARNTREEFANYKTKIAEKLQSPQDLARVLSAIDDTLRKLEQATSNGQNDASENQKYEAQIIELQAEITRLKLTLETQNPLQYVTALDLLQELLRRLSTILKRN